ncbi:VOC family protein [Cellulosimicrobium arenosum]|uniref:Putative pterin-4-alpha-carbinolamine dehydratase n=1 Tax=Cellulosimicrobium arenosum TaxID=2708133 RepID=A0A927J220_9MICO|nr:VOC family protein [Cellulosimicrobium arenosum]MBD8080453.1 4a-hydroxytetrahydrobiopterin dehydratase [Cellulosimicrobium arenosum]
MADDRISAREFHDSDGVEDWRVVLASAQTRFRTGSFTAGVELVDAIGELADAADHHPDVDLRYPAVTVRLTSHDVGGLSRRDVELARQISAAARELDLVAAPESVQKLEIAVDTLVGPAVQPFWRAVLGYDEQSPDGSAAPALADATTHGPGFWFQQMDAPREQRNRIHVDVCVPHDVAEARVTAAIAAGGHLVSDESAPAFWVLADAEGNEACVCTWQSRD